MFYFKNIVIINVISILYVFCNNEDLARRFAPILHFHNLEQSHCCFPTNAEIDYPLIINNPNDINFQSCNPKNLATATTYYQIYHKSFNSLIRIKYWFWYRYNKPHFSGNERIIDGLGDHPGDWESIEIIIFNNIIYGFILSCHDKEIFLQNNKALLNGEKVNIWIGLGTHANYPNFNDSPRKYYEYCKGWWIFKYCYWDKINNIGQIWDTANNIKDIYETNFAKDPNNYSKRWGDPTNPLNREFNSKPVPNIIFSEDFDPVYYLINNPDVEKVYGRNNFQGAREHWIKFGIKEGRRGAMWYDTIFYLNNYSDLKNVFKSNYEAARIHWINNGITEGRKGSNVFSISSYLNKYPDLKNAFGSNYKNAFVHWLRFGIWEGRDGT